MKILLVEDNPLDIDLTRRELVQALTQLELALATSVGEALAALAPGAPFEAVLTDLRLPDGTGLDVLNHIRHNRLPHAVVVLAGQGDEEIAVSAIKAGADDYVPKRPGYYKRLPQILRLACERFRQEEERKTGLLRVLYAEHHPPDAELTRRHLARHAPHIQLHVAHSSAEMLARLAATAQATDNYTDNYDVLLLDFNLPGGDALEVLKTLHDERRRNLPVVLVTGQGDEEVAVQALRLGAIDYIVKHAGYLYELPVALENAHFHARLAREQAALRASEDRFRRLAENATDLIYRYAFLPEPHFEYVSPSASAITGYTPEEHYADPELGFKLVHPSDQHLLLAAAQDRADYTDPLVLRWRRKDGTVIWTEQRTKAIYDSEGRLIALEGIARDVTAARQATEEMEQHLAEMEALHRVSNALRTAQTEGETVLILLDQTLAALKTDAGAVWLYSEASGQLHVVCASGWCQHPDLTTMMPGEGITGEVFVTARPQTEDDMAHSARLFPPARAYIPEGWSGGWAPIRTSDETVGVLFVAVYKPHTMSAGQIKLVVSLAEMAGSILQRLRLLEQAQAQAELTRQILNTVPEGLVLLGSEGHILMTNAPAQRILDELGVLGANAVVAGIAGHSLAELLAPAPGAWRELQFQGRTFTVNAQPVEPQAPATSWVLVLVEVTKARELQRYQEAQDRLATVGQLAAGIAHDFNNVLGIISVYADAMQVAPNLSSKQQQQLSTVVEQTHHAASLVRQVLDFSRRSVMERSRIDLYPLVNEQVKLLARALPENIHLHFSAEEKQFQVNADPTRLRQVLMNLAINARDAMPAGGTLAFTLARVPVQMDGDSAQPPLPDMAPGQWVRLAVSDNGAGIQPAHLPHIFEPFFTTKAPGQGTGLGLAQVYGIVKQHDGALNVTSSPGQGAMFELYLPLIEDAHPHRAAAPMIRSDRGSECILLVEDNVDLCTALAQSLETLGYRVLQAFDGATALHLATQPETSVDLVLSDMVMPGWNGLELYAALREYQPKAELLIMTGHPMSATHTAALQEYSGFWIQKPFALSELAGRVRIVLDLALSRHAQPAGAENA